MRAESTTTARRLIAPSWNACRTLVLACFALAPFAATAQTADPGLGLVGLPYANDVERAAAQANQRVFDALDASCNPGGIFDTVPEPSAPPVGSSCTDEGRFLVYLNSRELVHTANEIRGSGATIASLGQNVEGLGRALRWTAAEELAVQGSMATEFSNGQLSNLAARLSALRFGARGFGVANLYRVDPRRDRLLASADGQDAAAAGSGEPARETYSPWGGFLNGAFGYGSKEPTPLEDAFDFDGSELTLGVDYRLPSNVVFGGILGLSDQAIDFDETASDVSVVDGNIDAEGTSAILFALFQGERLSVSGSIGAQSLRYDVVRNIKYPSFNPELESANSIANSHPETDVRVSTFNLGYAFGSRKFTVEPFVNAEYLDATVDAFDEERSINLLSNDGVSKRFDLSISEQKFDSLDTAFGLRLQYVVTPRFGVIVPYLTLEAHRELADDARTITAGYAAVADVLGTSTFVVPTDAPDERYTVAGAGFSIVLRGGRQREAGGAIVGGLSAFLQIKTIQDLLHYDDNVTTGGFRYEF
ncbi:MAG TPA: autotransporter outer membrane beta-barrel domain-containing protein [Rhodanobacteraceae bacterium]|nr:autotransporter outer membrane beta-barrel domain-containing protein [Rhodanobacteraceae bacterium]